jgi:DNA-binding transcriptional LysR family regulator
MGRCRVQWDDVRILLGLLRAKNLHEASKHLDLDRSTISRRVSGLEKQLGVKLFDRTRDGLRPTVAAERLRPHAERMELEAVDLKNAARGREANASGIVRVATTEGLGALLIRKGLLALKNEHPALVIELAVGNVPCDVLRGEADIALRVGVLRHSSLKVRCLQRNGVALFASPAYLRAHGVPRSRRSLRGHEILLPSGELARLPEVRWLTKQAELRVVFRTNSMLGLIAAAQAGLGLVPLPIAWGQGQSGLELAMALEEIPVRPIWLVMPAGDLRPAVRVVADRITMLWDSTSNPIQA